MPKIKILVDSNVSAFEKSDIWIYIIFSLNDLLK